MFGLWVLAVRNACWVWVEPSTTLWGSICKTTLPPAGRLPDASLVPDSCRRAPGNCGTHSKSTARCETSKLRVVEKRLLFHSWKLHFLGCVPNFIHLFSNCSQVLPLCQGSVIGPGTCFLPLRKPQSRKGRTGRVLRPYKAERGKKKMLQIFSNLAIAGLASPWYSLVWIKSPNRWLYWVN